MSEALSPTQPPKVGFVSLGCPKNLTDSELILTQLSAEGYQTAKSFEGADLVIVNTCGLPICTPVPQRCAIRCTPLFRKALP